MIFLCHVNTNIKFKRGTKKGSKNKLRRANDIYKDIDIARQVVFTGNATSKELRSWVQLICSFQ